MDFTGFLGNDAIKRRLSGAFASGRVAHSYLLCGPAGSGKHTLARILCAAMECEKDGAAVPCGVCPGCRKALAGIHPDVITVDDPDHKAMTVDPIRAARSDMFIRPNEGRRKIYVIPRGQDMNESAQNALLKILEEPPDYGAFLILSTNAERLLPTIRSRCVELRLSPLPEAVLLPALRERFPDVPEDTLRAAGVRAGGYLGRAESILRDDAGLLPQSAAFVRAYCARRPEELLQVLAPMERLKREQLRPILTQWQALLVSALTSRSGLPPLRPECAQIAEARPVSDITQAIEAIRLALRDLEGNVSPGAICGALTVKLR